MNQKKKSGIKEHLLFFLLNNNALFIFIILFLTAAVSSNGLFLTYVNLSLIIRQLPATIIIALGFAVVLAAGGIDLSVGQMLGFIGILYAIMTFYLPFWMALTLTLGLGILCGFMNGIMTELFRLPSFMLTLATAQVFNSLAHLFGDGASVGEISDKAKAIGQDSVFGVIPISILIAIAVCIILGVVLYRTNCGKHIAAAGVNEKTSPGGEMKTRLIRISSYMVMGGFAALSAIMLTGRIGAASPGTGDGMEMEAIAAAAMGGTSLRGGKVKVGGVILGCLTLGVISSLFNILSIKLFWQWFIKGCILIFALIINIQSEKLLEKRYGINNGK